MYSTSFDPTKVNVNELETLATWLAKKTGGEVTVSQVILVTTTSVEVSNMLDALRNSLKNGVGKRAKAMKVREAKAPKSPKVQSQDGVKKEPTRGRGVKSIRVYGTDEMISRFELNKRLSEKTITIGTTLHSPKHGDITVQQRGDSYVVENSDGVEV